MKKFNCFILAAMVPLCFSCERNLSITSTPDGCSSVSLDTKSFFRQAEEMGLDGPDTKSFSLVITDQSGTAYDGLLSGMPDTVTVRAGVCSFKVQSRSYAGPVKDSPVYGDYIEKELEAGDFFTADLSCRQLTCGVLVSFSNEFREEYPDAFVRIIRRDSDTGDTEHADYLPSESGFYHFMPGVITINLMKDKSSSPELLTGRICSAADMFSVAVKLASKEAYGVINVAVDTLVQHYGETYSYGRKREGRSVYDALNVEDASLYPDDTVWVAGYITGCYVNRKWHPGVDSAAVSTNISLSSSPDATSDGVVTIPVSVSTGDCKKLNLKTYPSRLGDRVAVYGIPGKLYDLDGIKKSVDYVLL